MNVATDQGQSQDRPWSVRVPQPALGLELIGQYEGSGLKEPPYLVRRADGQIVQLTQLLFWVTSLIDGRRTFDEIATEIRERHGRELDGDDVQMLVDAKLRPAGLIVESGERKPVKRTVPLLALRFRSRVIPARVVGAITKIFYPLFFAPVVALVVGAFIALDVWLFAFHGTAQPVRHVIYEPGLVVLSFALVVLSTFLHECGHATACRYGGGRPGPIGVGIYLIWPAFFTDVTDSYRLDRKGRIRTDLGGVYFNALFSLATAALYFATGIEALLVVIVLQHAQMLYQFLPFLRLDGYYLVADITGVPDLFTRIGPTLRSLVPWRHDRRADDLQPWARVVVTAWVLSTVAFLVVMFGAFALAVPRIVATAGDSLALRYDAFRAALDSGTAMQTFAAGLQMAALVLPLVGSLLLVARIVKKAGAAAKSWMDNVGLRGGLVTATAAIAFAVALSWGPGVTFEPISPGESWAIEQQSPSDEPPETVESHSSSVALASAPQARSATFDFVPLSEAASEAVLAANTIVLEENDQAEETEYTGEVSGETTGTTSEPEPTASESPSPTPTPTPTPTEEPSPTPTPSESPSSEPAPSPTPTP
jgi:putative peptide zinc metalloprotease protein